MFKIKNYTNFQIGETIYSNQEIIIPVKINIDEQKIEKDLKKMRKMLFNLRKLYDKDFILIVTENNIELEIKQ